MKRCPVCDKRVIARGDAIEVTVSCEAHLDDTPEHRMKFSCIAMFHRHCYFRVRAILAEKLVEKERT